MLPQSRLEQVPAAVRKRPKTTTAPAPKFTRGRADTRPVTAPDPRTAPATDASASPDAEHALVGAERWMLWRTLSRGLAHGLANAAQMLALDPIPPAARAEALERIHVAIARLAEVHRPAHAGPVVPADALDELQAVQRLQVAFPSTELRLDVAAGLPALGIPADDLAHVLLVLVTQAKQAAGDARAAIEVRAHAHADGVAIEVADGRLFRADLERERTFDPFAGGDPSRPGPGLHVARVLCRHAGGDLAFVVGRSSLRLELPPWRRPAS